MHNSSRFRYFHSGASMSTDTFVSFHNDWLRGPGHGDSGVVSQERKKGNCHSRILVFLIHNSFIDASSHTLRRCRICRGREKGLASALP